MRCVAHRLEVFLAHVAEHERHALREYTLRACEQLRVKAQLQKCRSLRGACELRVDWLVRPGAERRRTIDATQKVGAAEPAWQVLKCTLIDDVNTAVHGIEGELDGIG